MDVVPYYPSVLLPAETRAIKLPVICTTHVLFNVFGLASGVKHGVMREDEQYYGIPSAAIYQRRAWGKIAEENMKNSTGRISVKLSLKLRRRNGHGRHDPHIAAMHSAPLLWLRSIRK